MNQEFSKIDIFYGMILFHSLLHTSVTHGILVWYFLENQIFHSFSWCLSWYVLPVIYITGSSYLRFTGFYLCR